MKGSADLNFRSAVRGQCPRFHDMALPSVVVNSHCGERI
jgi:hypothetical protein